MAENSKLKILYILDIMKKTDEQHPLNATQIAEQLEYYGVSGERKSIGRDLQCLEDAGYSIIKCANHNQGWYMTDQDFEEYELKMLVDAVAMAKFLPVKESRALIQKIKALATKEGEHFIAATTIIDPSIKLADSQFKFKFDLLMRAITEHKQVSFRYYDLTARGEKKLRHNGFIYRVSPYYIALVYEEYFALVNPATNDHTGFFRIEMMTDLQVLDTPVRSMSEIAELKSIGKGMTIGDYLRQSVNLWTGPTENVTLHCEAGCRHNLMMKFGKDISIADQPDGSFNASVKVSDNSGFYQWLAGYGPNIIIDAPAKMREKYLEYLDKTRSAYAAPNNIYRERKKQDE